MLRSRVLSALGVLTFFCISAAAQVTVNRYDLFTGYSHLSAPSVSLGQNGFDTSFGVNANRWLALGADFSVFTGGGSIPISDTKIQAQVIPLLPPGPLPSIPFNANTYTFAAGPQFNIRHFQKVWFFVRPGLGLIHEHATLEGPLVAALGPALGISAVQTDTTYFYGAGGGVDLNTSKHVGFRVSFDFVRTPLFSDLLDTRNAFRVSVGPTWKWGEVK